jgi:hypothetical protein
MTEPTLAAEKAEKTHATQPTEPIDRMDPADPIDRIEPLEPMLRIEPLDPMLRIEPLEPGEPDKAELAPPGRLAPRGRARDESPCVFIAAFSHRGAAVDRALAALRQAVRVRLVSPGQ